MTAAIQTNFRVRQSFGKIDRIIDIPNLIDIQMKSYEKFLQANVPPNERQDLGLQGVFRSVFPIRDFNGTIDPIKALKLIWRLKVRKLETGRLLLFGVKPKFRTRELYGLPFVLLYELYLGSLKGRYRWCEESWILETNGPMNAMMPYWDAYVYKKYRIYEKAL